MFVIFAPTAELILMHLGLNDILEFEMKRIEDLQRERIQVEGNSQISLMSKVDSTVAGTSDVRREGNANTQVTRESQITTIPESIDRTANLLEESMMSDIAPLDMSELAQGSNGVQSREDKPSNTVAHGVEVMQEAAPPTHHSTSVESDKVAVKKRSGVRDIDSGTTSSLSSRLRKRMEVTKGGQNLSDEAGGSSESSSGSHTNNEPSNKRMSRQQSCVNETIDNSSGEEFESSDDENDVVMATAPEKTPRGTDDGVDAPSGITAASQDVVNDTFDNVAESDTSFIPTSLKSKETNTRKKPSCSDDASSHNNHGDDSSDKNTLINKIQGFRFQRKRDTSRISSAGKPSCQSSTSSNIEMEAISNPLQEQPKRPRKSSSDKEDVFHKKPKRDDFVVPSNKHTSKSSSSSSSSRLSHSSTDNSFSSIPSPSSSLSSPVGTPRLSSTTMSKLSRFNFVPSPAADTDQSNPVKPTSSTCKSGESNASFKRTSNGKHSERRLNAADSARISDMDRETDVTHGSKLNANFKRTADKESNNSRSKLNVNFKRTSLKSLESHNISDNNSGNAVSRKPSSAVVADTSSLFTTGESLDHLDLDEL